MAVLGLSRRKIKKFKKNRSRPLKNIRLREKKRKQKQTNENKNQNKNEEFLI